MAQHTLATFCEEIGITYLKLANRAGLSPSYISMIANGKRPKVRFTTQIRLAKALNLPLSEFQKLLSASATTTILPLHQKRDPFSLFYELLEGSLAALHNNDIAKFRFLSTELLDNVSDTVPLKTNFLFWYTALTLTFDNRFESAKIEMMKAAQFKAMTPLEKQFKAKILSSTGSIFIALGHYKEALKMFRTSLLVCGHGEQAAVVYLNMGTLFRRKHHFTSSLKAYEKAISMGNPQLQILAYSGLGQLAMDYRYYPSARKYLLTGYCLSGTLDKDLHKGDILCNLGKYYKELLKYRTAIRILNKGLVYARRSHSKRTMLFILAEMADIYLVQNNVNGFSETVSVIHSEMNAEGDFLLMGTLLIVIAEQYFHSSRYDEALLALDSCYRLLNDKTPTTELSTSCSLLHQIHQKAQRFSQASFFSDEVKRIQKVLKK